MDNTTEETKQQVHFLPRYIVEHDYNGNPVVLQDNEDGTWSDLYNEQERSEEYVRKYWPHLFTKPQGATQ